MTKFIRKKESVKDEIKKKEIRDTCHEITTKLNKIKKLVEEL